MEIFWNPRSRIYIRPLNTFKRKTKQLWKGWKRSFQRKKAKLDQSGGKFTVCPLLHIKSSQWQSNPHRKSNGRRFWPARISNKPPSCSTPWWGWNFKFSRPLLQLTKWPNDGIGEKKNWNERKKTEDNDADIERLSRCKGHPASLNGLPY